MRVQVSGVILLLAFTALAGCTAFEPQDAVSDLSADSTPKEHKHASHHAGADERYLEHGIAGDHHAQTGMARPLFPEAEGSVPSEAQAKQLPRVNRIIVESDEDFVGLAKGNGTLADPYIFEGLFVSGDLYIADTDACIVVRENWIDGQLTLNWNGQCVHVHHNYIRDLRVNENIPRLGYATGGLLEMNKISYIGQLRHYDGEFRYNVAGPYNPNDIFDEVLETVPWLFVSDPRVANIDGFNQGHIHHNTFHGSVDLDYHGHHHGTGFFATHSHYHGDEEERGMDHDHTNRWTSVKFEYNKIIDPEGYGLRYDDQNHAGDDQTANSESEETLELPHLHHSKIEIIGNVIEGGQIWIDVFHAADRLHKAYFEEHNVTNEGWLDIIGNQVHMVERDELDLLFIQMSNVMDSAINMGKIAEVEVRIHDNILSYQEVQGSALDIDLSQDRPRAIHINQANLAQIDIRGNKATGFDVGAEAWRFQPNSVLTLADNDWGTAMAFDGDGSVVPT